MVDYLSGSYCVSNAYLDRINLIRGDILEQDTDVIATTLPQSLDIHEEVTQRLLDATGGSMDEYLRNEIRRPEINKIYIAEQHNLSCQVIFFYIRHHWKDVLDPRDHELMEACRLSLEEMRTRNLSTISFPPLDMRPRGFPVQRGARLMVKAITQRLTSDIKEVRLVCEDYESYNAFHKRLRLLGWLGFGH